MYEKIKVNERTKLPQREAATKKSLNGRAITIFETLF